MKRQRQRQSVSIFDPHYSSFVLQRTIDALNSATERQPVWVSEAEPRFATVDCTERQEELRALIAKWHKAGQNLNRLFKANPDLADSCTRGSTLLIPDRDGRPQLAWSSEPGHLGSWSPQKRLALMYFAEFLVCPLSRSLGGPCERCGKYYRKKDSRQKTYCSKQCGRAQTATTATRRRREQQYAKKLERVQESVSAWTVSRRRGDWKEWVSNRSREDRRFITQAVKRGRLVPPLASP